MCPSNMLRPSVVRTLCAGVVVALAVGFAPLGAREIKITILHTNDIHQHLETLGRIAHLAKEYKNQHANTLYLDAGDYLDRGSILATLTRCDAIYGAMHRMGYDAWTIGNHDWTYGADRLAELMKRYPTRVLCTNVASSLKEPPKNLVKTWVTEIDGVRIGFLGVTTGPAHKSPLPVYRLPLRPAVRTAIGELQAKNVDFIAALTHLGVTKMHSYKGMNDLVFAKEFPEIKVIIGGHSHTLINQELADKFFKETGTIIVQAGASGGWLGILTLTVDRQTKAIRSFRVQPRRIETGMAEDRDVAGFVKSCFKKHLPDAHLELGDFTEPMELYNMGYWYADFLRKTTGADIVIVPRKALYDEHPVFGAGPVTVERIIGILHDRRVVKFSMKGADLIRYFGSPEVREHFNPFHLDNRDAHWLFLVAGAYYYSGMEVAYHEKDGRVTFDLEPDKTYTIATLWPFLRKDIYKYRYTKPPADSAQAGVIFPGLSLPANKEVLPDTTWDLLRREGKQGPFVFRRKYKTPLLEWKKWTKDFKDVAHVFLPNVERPSRSRKTECQIGNGTERRPSSRCEIGHVDVKTMGGYDRV